MDPHSPTIEAGFTAAKLSSFLSATFWLSMTHVGLLTIRAAGMRRILPESPDQSPLPDASEAAMVAWAINRATRFVPGSACLAQAMAGQTLLALRGRQSNVTIGVKRLDDGTFTAHAWLVAGSMVILGGPLDESYSVMPQSRATL